ncbi:helix-turn-helix domain-containing protein [Microtetraspora glauca]|uniref:Helix-turn-helix domain-containing protein n=1 Tax=Microtetraspora glauca TaxID=1996 RepID=A0ABV3GA74_MICGL
MPKPKPKEPSDTALLTIPETATELRVGDNTVYRMIARGDLTAVDISAPGARKSKTRVPRESIHAYLKRLTPAASTR